MSRKRESFSSKNTTKTIKEKYRKKWFKLKNNIDSHLKSRRRKFEFSSNSAKLQSCKINIIKFSKDHAQLK